MKLYTYFRSSASYRVRIAMNLKGLSYEAALIHLVKDGGGHNKPEFRALNPQGLLPVFVDDDGNTVAQSMAIMEYLEDLYPAVPLLPADAFGRAQVRSIAQAISCDIHPVNNLRVLQYLGGTLGHSEEERNTWYRHWTESGLLAVEQMLTQSGQAGRFCHGDTPTIADCCLVPQMFNAKRFECDLSRMPTLARINDTCLAMEAFAAASPARQPDAA